MQHSVMKATPLREIYRDKVLTHVIPVYGTKEEPLYDATYIAHILGMQNHRTTTRFFAPDEYRVMMLRNCDKSHKATMLPLAGLKRLVLSRGITELTTAMLQWIETTTSDIAAKHAPAASVKNNSIAEQRLSELEKANTIVLNLQNELSLTREELAMKDDKVAELDDKVAKMDRSLFESDKENDRLRNDNQQLSNRIDVLDGQIMMFRALLLGNNEGIDQLMG